MADYINRETAIKEMLSRFWDGKETLREIMMSIPAADVAEVRHARWEARPARTSAAQGCSMCSNCGATLPLPPHFAGNFCSNCGAKMGVG